MVVCVCGTLIMIDCARDMMSTVLCTGAIIMMDSAQGMYVWYNDHDRIVHVVCTYGTMIMIECARDATIATSVHKTHMTITINLS
jgi:hypothetical protein